MEGVLAIESEIGIGGLPGTVCEYKMALGAERKNDKDAMDGFAFLGVLGVVGCGCGGMLSAAERTGGIFLCRAMGGGAAESKDEARVMLGLARGRGGLLSWPSRKIAGLMSWSHQGRALKSMVEGRDSRSASSSANRSEVMLEDVLNAAGFALSSTGPFDVKEEVLG